MDNRIYLNDLYDLYGDLLTVKQKEYFEGYYFDNLTLQEISENNAVSRNAVFKQIKEVEEKLIHLEDILKLYEKNKRIKDFSNKLSVEEQKELLKIIMG